MELDAFDGQTLVANAHDVAVVGPCRDFETLRQRLAVDHERVIARRDEWIRQVPENAAAVMPNGRSLAVHELARVHDASTESLSYALVAEAHAEERNLACEAFDKRHRNARLVGRAGSRGNHDTLGLHSRDIVDRDLVISTYDNLFAELAEILDEVVGKGIVVVD